MSSLSHLPSSLPLFDPKQPEKLSLHKDDHTLDSEAPHTPLSTEALSLHLSPESQSREAYQNHMRELPDIRQDRITHLQQAIAQGTYVVPAEKLADKLIQEL
jgi:flagellar biosynthesis anti-sigma factor FlgM